MCAIVGIREREPEGRAPERFAEMLDSMRHRGPDDSGTYHDLAGGVHLGHCRLSILDLSAAGHQPMINPSGTVAITYNGEVYNFREIRAELEGLGFTFTSNSDTEVVLKAYEAWGMECLHRFRGMFAFALWDRKRERLFLVRDRAGVKPLYYHHDAHGIGFASELRALMRLPRLARRIDRDAVRHFLQFGYISAPGSVFEGVRTVRPGHYLEVDGRGEAKEVCYWSILDHYRAGLELERSGYWETRPEDEVVEEFEAILSRAFGYRMVADVPVGLFLSGGIDSSLVAAVLVRALGVPLKTFTIGYRQTTFDEAEHARKVARALGTEHRELYLEPETVLDTVRKIPLIYDEPFGDNSGVPTYLVSRMAREEVKVALSADGADELFAGYSRYHFIQRFERFLRTAPPLMHRLGRGVLDTAPPGLVRAAYRLATVGRTRRSAFYDKVLKVRHMLGVTDPAALYNAANSYWCGAGLDALVAAGPDPGAPPGGAVFDALRGAPLMTRMMCHDFTRYMVDDILTKLDRASMAVSLEVREPFLDHELVEFAARLPLRYKYRDGESKYLLRRVLYKHLPRGLFERPKQGFAAPIGDWLRGPLRPMVQDRLTGAGIAADGLLDPRGVERAVRAFYGGGRVTGVHLWYLLEYRLWREAWTT